GVFGAPSEERRDRGLCEAPIPRHRGRQRRTGGRREGTPPSALRGHGRSLREDLEEPPARRGRDGGPDLWSSGSSTNQPLGGGRRVAAECVLQGDPPGVRAAAQPDG